MKDKISGDRKLRRLIKQLDERFEGLRAERIGQAYVSL